MMRMFSEGYGVTRKQCKSFRFSALLCFLLVMQCVVWVSQASAATPTQQQLDMLRDLPVEKQAEILRYLNKRVKKTTPIKHPAVVEAVKPISDIESPSQIINKPISDIQIENFPHRQPISEDEITNELRPFGYDLFSSAPTAFSPVTDIPVPINYVIGPGDSVQVQIFGKENAEYELVVDRDGQLQFPDIGPIAVTGMRFDELKSNLARRISKQIIGVKVHVSLGALRSMRVFIMGDVSQPGSYMVSALSTMTNALFVSGGVKTIGSLRNIQLKRQGKIVQRMDLYDLLLDGNTSTDARIQPGDVIFVPPVGKTVGIAGEVRRPAIYEIKSEKTVAQVLEMSGGLLPTAYGTVSQLERINAHGERTLVNIDLSSDMDKTQPVKDGDVIRIFSILDKMENIIFASGHLQRPGSMQWREGMRLSDVIHSIKDLLPEPNLQFVLVRRERQPDRAIEVLMSRLDKVLIDEQSAANLLLQPRDEIFVFGLSEDALKIRDETLEKLVRELRQQANFEHPESVVGIEGNVRWPGDYPLSKNMRLQTLIHAAGDMKPNTDARYVLLIREQLRGNHIAAQSFDLSRNDRLADENNPTLSPRDKIYVFDDQADRSELMLSSLARIKAQANIGAPAAILRISGLVRSPGEYPLEEGMRVSDIMRAAGGLTEAAYELEAEVSRYEVDAKKTRVTRHIPVKLSDLLAGVDSADIVLQPHDILHIKRLPHWSEQRVVEIGGEVRFPGRYPVRRGETLNELLVRAGGLTDQAFPEGAIFVRESLRRKEQEQLEIMSARLESDLAAVDLEKANITDEEQRSVGMASSLLEQLRSTKAVGRLVINLPELLVSGNESVVKRGVLLRDGDKLFIPPVTQEVTILGEVQHSTSHLFQEGLSVQDYIDKSGGHTYHADEGRIYVVRANGAVLPSHSAEWFGDYLEIMPGDTIVVPLDAERMKSLTLWTNVSQIIYQIGIAAASWNAVGVF